MIRRSAWVMSSTWASAMPFTRARSLLSHRRRLGLALDLAFETSSEASTPMASAMRASKAWDGWKRPLNSGFHADMPLHRWRRWQLAPVTPRNPLALTGAEL